nr:uncharacterized protein CI109_004662 [Kwoniella shandongensis]KAA5526886.1 hypothetical protein CI109_004662 [Kwoniella shandongensis]
MSSRTVALLNRTARSATVNGSCLSGPRVPLGGRVRWTSNQSRVDRNITGPQKNSNSLIVASVAAASLVTLLSFTTWPTLHADSEISKKTHQQESASSTKKTTTEPGRISAEELADHKSLKSLWVAVDGDVWDVTDFANQHPGGTEILVQHAGRDVTRIFKAIHPTHTVEKNLTSEQLVGRLDDSAIKTFASTYTDEEKKIGMARAKLFGVDSVVSLDDFERYAKDLLIPAAWYYYSTGADGEHSLFDNADAYNRVHFRPRVMRNVTDPDLRTKILGVESTLPFYVSPTARNGLGQPLGEIAVTRGAGATGILQVLSHYASRSLEEVISETKEGQKVGWQIYTSMDREKSAREIREAYRLGAQSIWVTVDTAILGKREKERRAQAERTPAAHGKPLSPPLPKNAYAHDTGLTWKDIDWIKSLAPGLPIVIKGVGAWEDVVLAQKYGADAVVLSNHGGRQLDYANPPLKTLHDLNVHSPSSIHQPDFQIFVDGGIRHGTDILKALCLGANAVGLGRPFIYAATGWGSDGVERAVQILKEELEIGMILLGVTRLDQLGPEYVDVSKL